MKNAVGVNGIFKDKALNIVGTVEEIFGPVNIQDLAHLGNWAAINCLRREQYAAENEPFYYGKMGPFGYIISAKDFKFI